jgi:hypothetical protein
MADSSREVVIVTTDWRLEQANGRTFGMCFVRFSAPYDSMNIKRGFNLHGPTHQRCALFSLVLGLEAVLDRNVFQNAGIEAVISTKSKRVHSLVTSGSDVDRWEATGRWPKDMVQLRNLLMRARDLAAELYETHPGSVIVHIDRDKDEEASVNLLKDADGVDMDAVAKEEGAGAGLIEKRLREMRMRGVMVEELLASGARGSRSGKMPPSEKAGKKKKVQKATKREKDGASTSLVDHDAGGEKNGSHGAGREDDRVPGPVQGDPSVSQGPERGPVDRECRPEEGTGVDEGGDGRPPVPPAGSV